MTETNKTSACFYFALPRMISRFAGLSPSKSEGHVLEAHLGSILIFLVSYLFAVRLFVHHSRNWTAPVIYVLAALGVWVFWLLALYLNSLVIKALRTFGFFDGTPDRHAQDILVGILITILAGELCMGDSWSRWIGIVVLTMLALNLLAALLLLLTGKQRS